MVKCSMCGVEIRKGTGKMYIKADSKILHFCGSKCQKNMLKLKHKPIATRWSAQYFRGKK